MHVNVLLTGRLVGMGQQAGCEVMVRRISRTESGESIYGDPVIIHAPNELPEGEYMLFFDNVSIPVLHKGVLWMPSGPPPEKERDSRGSNAPSPANLAKGAASLARRMIHDRRRKK